MLKSVEYFTNNDSIIFVFDRNLSEFTKNIVKTMVKGCELTPRKKAVIIALNNEGLSSRVISDRIGFNHSTVSRLLQKFRQTGSVERTMGRGRKKASTVADDRFLVRLSLKNRRASSTVLKREWEESSGVNVTSRTVRNRLLAAGLAAHRPRKKPLLTKAMRTARLKWARDHATWTAAQWNSVIFSDESKFNLHGSDGPQYVRRRSGEEYHPTCITSTVKHPQGQMIWGCISSHGVGRLHFVTGTVNAEVYINILQTKLLPTIRDQYRDVHGCIFQDDSAPCHRAKKVKDFLASSEIATLTWPGNSPDLNPIENCWKFVGVKLAAKKPRNKRELQEAIIHVWNHELTADYLQKLILSMPTRIKAVIKARGGTTKY